MCRLELTESCAPSSLTCKLVPGQQNRPQLGEGSKLRGYRPWTKEQNGKNKKTELGISSSDVYPANA